MRQRCGKAGKQRLRLAAEYVGDGRTDAPIRHMHDIEIGGDFQLLHREMRQRAGTRRAVGELAGICLNVSDELLHAC